MPFEPQRSTRKFCSGTCRTAAHRGKPATERTEDELLELDVDYELAKKLGQE